MVKYIHICQNGIYGVAQGAHALNIWNHLFFCNDFEELQLCCLKLNWSLMIVKLFYITKLFSDNIYWYDKLHQQSFLR